MKIKKFDLFSSVNIYFIILLILFLALLLCSCKSKRHVTTSKKTIDSEIKEEIKIKLYESGTTTVEDSTKEHQFDNLQFETDEPVHYNSQTGEIDFKPKGKVNYQHHKKLETKHQEIQVKVKVTQVDKAKQIKAKKTEAGKNMNKQNSTVGWGLGAVAIAMVLFTTFMIIKFNKP